MSSILRKDSLPANNYTILSNAMLRDSRLSLKARGLLGYLCSHSEGWEISVESLARDNNCGEAQVKSALAELRDVGYLRLDRHTDRGRVTHWEYVLLDPTVPHVEKQLVAPPHVGNRHAKEDYLSEDHLEEHMSADADACAPARPAKKWANYTPDFEEWWAQYPRRVGKRKAFEAYERARHRLGAAAAETLLRAIQKYALAVKDLDERYIPHAATWLNRDGWDDEMPATRGPKEDPRTGYLVER